MGMNYNALCNLLDDSSEPFVKVNDLRADAAQDAWVRTLESRAKKGKENPQANNVRELLNEYEDDAGLVVTAYRSAYEDARSALEGHNRLSPDKARLLRDMFSIDIVSDEGVLTAEEIEDVAANVAFAEIEEQDLVVTDPRYQALDDYAKQAVKRFTLAWTLREEGYTIPSHIKVQISRDRKKTGLPFVLERGPIG